MKKLLILLSFLYITVFSWGSAAFAVPFLHLDISNRILVEKSVAPFKAAYTPDGLLGDDNKRFFNQKLLADVAGFSSVFVRHFDLFKKNSGFKINNLEPLSPDDGRAPAPVPEPAIVLLFGSGLLGLAGARHGYKVRK